MDYSLHPIMFKDYMLSVLAKNGFLKDVRFPFIQDIVLINFEGDICRENDKNYRLEICYCLN